MEGSRNERVAILLTAYVIGFMTAYIAFGITQLEDKVEFVYIETASQTASVAAVDIAPEIVPETTVPVLKETDEGLLFTHAGESVFLSAYIADTEADLPEGMHTAIAHASISPDGTSVYFCEVPSTDAVSCRPYIYSAVTDAVIPVRMDGERVAFDVVDHAVVWNDDGTVSLVN